MKIDLAETLRTAFETLRPDLVKLVRGVLLEEMPRLVSGDPDQMLDAEQTAALIGMTPAALRRATERGRFPVEPHRIGRRLRWRRGDIVASLSASSRSPQNTTAQRTD